MLRALQDFWELRPKRKALLCERIVLELFWDCMLNEWYVAGGCDIDFGISSYVRNEVKILPSDNPPRYLYAF